MKDIQKIKEFFSNPLEKAEEEETPVDMAKKQLDALGVEYKMSGNKFRPFEAIYRPKNESDEFYGKFNRIVYEFNLESAVKQKMSEAQEEESLYKDWDQFEKPSKIKVYLNNGKTLEISPLKLKGGKRVYDAILQAFIDDRFDITNKVIQGMINNLSEAQEEDVVDTITMDVPLFIRMLEYSREDADEDMDLHDITEKANILGKEKGVLSMEDYDAIVGSAETMNEVNLKQSKLSSAEYQKAKKLKDFKSSDWKWNADEDLYTKVVKEATDYMKRRKSEDDYATKKPKQPTYTGKTDYQKRRETEKKLAETIFSKLKETKSTPCWKGYEQKGMKKKDGRQVPNCVPKK